MISIEDIRAARARLDGVIYRTPLIPYYGDTEHSVFFKPESLQPIGSFKLRGAYNKIATLSPEVRARGVIAYSTGNHAQGVAYVARKFGIPALIVMPTIAPAVKIDATRAYGATVVLYDPATERREAVAARIMQETPYTLIPPFNDLLIMAGQGTIGLEIAEDLPDVDLVIAPVGGGGLVGGTATAIKALCPNAKVIGVEPALADDARQSLHSGKLIEIPPSQANRTIADGVRTLVIGDITFAQMQRFVDDIITVSEDDIRAATRHSILDAKLAVEPTGALALAAYLFHRDQLPPARNVVLIISGGSADPLTISQILAAGLPNV